MGTLKLVVAFIIVMSVSLVKSASVSSGEGNCNPAVYKFNDASAGVFLSGGASGGGPPPTKNPFVNKPIPASRLNFKFTEEELKCKREERDSLQKDVWMYEIR